MDMIKQPTSWFRSDAGAKAFSACTSLEERIIFLYSYLKTVIPQKVDDRNLVFKTALFFADAVSASDEEYAAYEKLVDPAVNPFLTYLTKLSKHPGNEQIYCSFLGCIKGIADPADDSCWIYNPDDLDLSDYLLMIEEETGFIPMTNAFVDPSKFEVSKEKQAMLLAVIWLWGKEDGRE